MRWRQKVLAFVLILATTLVAVVLTNNLMEPKAIAAAVIRYYSSTNLVDASALDASLGLETPTPNTSPYDTSITSLTPASDFVFGGFGDYQLIFGRAGSNAMYGFDHSLNPSNKTPVDIDTFFGKAEPVAVSLLQELIQILSGNPPSGGQDRFVFGDQNRSYYINDGYSDFALTFDFNPNEDIIQLHGSADDYQFITVPLLGTAIFQRSQQSPNFYDGDLVSVLFENFNLDPNGSNIRYVGSTSQAGPVEPKIKQLGTEGIDIATADATDSSGNVYVTGITNSSLAGPNAGSYDVLLTKYDSNGNQIWTKQFGSSKQDEAFATATDNLGNVYVVGSTQNNLAAQRQSAEADAWLAKFDPNGNQLWIQQFGDPGSSLNGATNIAVDESNNIYISGLRLTPDRREVAVIDDQDDFFVAKYDTDGNQQWYTRVGTPLSYDAIWDEAYGVTLSKDGSGSVYLTGWTYGGLAQDNAQLGNYDTWISKFDNDGQLTWIRQFGSTANEFGWNVDTDSQGNVYSYGWTQGNLAGNLDGFSNLFLAKYDVDGNQQWIRQFGPSGGDTAAFLGGLKIDSNDNIFITGYTDGSFGGTNAGSYDPFVARYDTDGNQVWATQFGSPELDYPTKIAVDTTRGKLYVTGLTEGSLGANNIGAADAWVSKLDVNLGNLEDFNPGPRRQVVTKPPSTPAIPARALVSSDAIGGLVLNRILNAGGMGNTQAAKNAARISDAASAPGANPFSTVSNTLSKTILTEVLNTLAGNPSPATNAK